MKWTKDNSIKLSVCCVWAFIAILAVLDVTAFWWIPAFTAARHMDFNAEILFFITVYSGSIFAYLLLINMMKLLRNISKELIFTAGNVSLLRVISWYCAAGAVISGLSTVYYLPFILVAAAAAFMMLLVRIIKNIMQQAVEMKSELDLTV